MRRFLVPILLLPILIAGCQPSSFMAKDEAPMMVQEGAMPMAAPRGMGGMRMKAAMNEADGESVPAERKIIQSADLDIEVKSITEASAQTKALMEKLEGFVADSREFENNAGRKAMQLTLRVPTERFAEVLAQLKTLGRVRQERISGEDVTEQYVDLEARLSNAKRLETRLLALLETKTKNLKDVLDTERELARVRERIETMVGRKRFLDNRLSLSTIEVSLSQPPGWGRGIFDPLSGSITRALGSFTTSLAFLIVALSAALPWIALLLFLFWLTVRFLRWRLHRHRARKAKEEKKEENK